jgi:hypothetical protein
MTSTKLWAVWACPTAHILCNYKYLDMNSTTKILNYLLYLRIGFVDKKNKNFFDICNFFRAISSVDSAADSN